MVAIAVAADMQAEAAVAMVVGAPARTRRVMIMMINDD